MLASKTIRSLSYLGKSRLAFLLAGILLFGQLHVCTQQFLNNLGQVCEKCTLIPVDADCEGKVAAPHGDCHDCCSISACDDEAKDVAKSSAVSVFQVAILLEEPAEPVFRIAHFPKQRFLTFDPSTPAHGPPLLRASRAPPVI